MSLQSSVAEEDSVSLPVEPESQPGESSVIRFGFAVLLAVVASGIKLGLGRLWNNELLALLPFCAILAASVRGGVGPGITATVVVAAAELIFPRAPAPDFFAQPAVRLLFEGLLVSLVGGQLWEVRRRAQVTLEAYQRLEKQVLEISDDERRRIGHDLHDGLGQHLTGISLLSESMAQQMQSGAPLNSEHVETITSLVSQAVSWTRDLARGLSPVTLENEGLVPALEELASTASTLFNVRCEWDYAGPEIRMDLQRSLHIFRITQEAISNSVKHGKAKKIEVGMRVVGPNVRLSIVDNGSGLSQKTLVDPGLGLRIMQYRARMAAARVSVKRASPSGGTVVTCEFAVDTSHAA